VLSLCFPWCYPARVVPEYWSELPRLPPGAVLVSLGSPRTLGLKRTGQLRCQGSLESGQPRAESCPHGRAGAQGGQRAHRHGPPRGGLGQPLEVVPPSGLTPGNWGWARPFDAGTVQGLCASARPAVPAETFSARPRSKTATRRQGKHRLDFLGRVSGHYA
jgi:hypothetical protein